MRINDREKSLLMNTGILAFGTMCSKIFSFFLLPLYTNVLAKEDFGAVDVLQTMASFIVPFLSLQLSAAMFRFIIDENREKNQSEIISTGVLLEVLNLTVAMIAIVIVNRFYPIEYCGLFVLYLASVAILEMAQNIIRGFGNNSLYAVMSFMMVFISVISNIVMILGLGMRGDSILVASSLAYFGATAIAVWRQRLWRFLRLRSFSRAKLKEMLRYCLPLIPNAVSWWITNASGRMIIRFFLGVGVNGIYAAANKILTIYTTIFNVYNIAWVESLSRSMGDEHQFAFVDSMFEKSVRFFGCINIGITCCMGILFKKIIGEEYAEAYNHVYILLIAIFFNSICSLFGGVLTAFKKSASIGNTTVLGAVVNLVLCALLMPLIKLYAASLAVLVSYIVIAVVRMIHVRKLIPIRLPMGYFVQFFGMYALTSVGYFLRILPLNIGILAVVALWSYWANRKMINGILRSGYGKLCSKLGKEPQGKGKESWEDEAGNCNGV